VRLIALGVDHRSAPAAVREALAFDGPKLADGLNALTREFPGCGFVVLSTCNRVEVYAGGDQPSEVPGAEDLADFLTRFHAVSADIFGPHLVSYHDEGVIGHLFRVAASLESLALGEVQILGQVREAYLSAQQRQVIGPILHRVFEQALRVARKVRHQTGMDRGRVSIASVAVDVAKEVFDIFSDKTMLVIGAGKMGDLTLRHLKELKPGRILVTNRNAERAEAAAGRWGAEAVPFEHLDQALIAADVVVSTTAADEPIVTYDLYARIQRARRNRLSLILDIAIPRDFDEAVGRLEQVLLYNVDDLRGQAERNLAQRQKGVDPALVMIEREAAECYASLRHQRSAGSVLRQLGDSTDAIRQRELEAVFAALPHLSESDRKTIAHGFTRFQNQVLHHPRAALRSAASEHPHDYPHPILNAVRHLFGLSDI
jgi:glutamyl-tRNA reductase